MARLKDNGGHRERRKIATFPIRPVSGAKTLYLSVAGEAGKRLADVKEMLFTDRIRLYKAGKGFLLIF